jgi:hypothetical protein
MLETPQCVQDIIEVFLGISFALLLAHPLARHAWRLLVMQNPIRKEPCVIYVELLASIHLAATLQLLLTHHRHRVPEEHRSAPDLLRVLLLLARRARRVALEADAHRRALDDELPVQLHDVQGEIDAAAARVQFARQRVSCREHPARYPILACGVVMPRGLWRCDGFGAGEGGD